MLESLTDGRGSIVPHLLLPCAQIAALTSPPFRCRAVLFLPLILTLVYYTWTNPFTEDPGLRAALLSVWPWYLGTIAKLLFNLPENDFWKSSQKAGAIKSASLKEKALWAADLCASLRGVGWNFEVKNITRKKKYSKIRFLADQLLWLCFCTLALDVLETYKEVHFYRHPIDPAFLTVKTKDWKRSIWHAVWALFTPYLSLNILYGQIAFICVVLGIGQAKDWPPLYGSIWQATTLRKFWNSWWHQCIRQTYMAYTKALVRRLRLEPGGVIASYVRLYTAFLISALGHAVVIYAMPYGPNHSMYQRFWKFFICFAVQAPAIHCEDIVLWLYSRIQLQPWDEKNLQKFQRDGKTPQSKSKCWHRIVGRLWLMIWVWLHSDLIADPCLTSGIAQANQSPLRMVRPVLTKLGLWERAEVLMI